MSSRKLLKDIRRTRVLKIILPLFLVISIAGLWAQSGSTGSVFYFARFVSSSNSDSGIAIFNPSFVDAIVTLNLFDAQGNPAADAQEIVVPRQGQIAKTGSQLFGKLGLDASLQLSSTTSGLVTCYQTFDFGGSYLDGAIAPKADLNLIFPFVPGNAAASFEMSLLNANLRIAAVDLSLWGQDGTKMAGVVVQVPRNGKIRDSLTNLFPLVEDFSAASHVTAFARSSSILYPPQPISGTCLFSLFPEKQADLAGLDAISLPETSNAGVIPHFRIGSRYFSTLSLANLEPASIDVSITAVGDDGSTLGVEEVRLAANGGLRKPLESLFPSLVESDKQGWIMLQASGRISGAVLIGRSDDDALAAVPMNTIPKLENAFAQVVQDENYTTEISLANAGSDPSFAEMFVIAPSGNTVASGRIVVPAGESTSRRLNQYLPEVDSLSGGALVIRASEPLFATATFWSISGSLASTISAQDVPPSYQPKPLEDFSVTGKVSVNGLVAEGFPVVLSGPLGKTTTTDADGLYSFSGLPAGKYSMIVDQLGFQFVPDQFNFEITNESIRQDFIGFTEENGIVVVPAAVPVGSPDVSATIFGRGFNESSQAWVDSIILSTIYQDSTRLGVSLPAYLFASPATFEVTVTTGDSTSDPYPLVAYRDRPVLTSAETDGDIVEGNQSATLRLKGSGFLPGAKVRINSLNDGITITYLSETEIIATVPAPYLAKGGIYPVTVENPYPANFESNIQLMTVFYPRPAIEFLWPPTASVKLEDSSGYLNLDVFGYGFRRGAVVYFNDVSLATFYCEDTPACLAEHIIARIPPELMRVSGFGEVTVRNPNPTLGASQVAFLRIEGLQPTITEVFPGQATVLDLPEPNNCYNLTVVVFGTNFGPQTEYRTYQLPNPEVPEPLPPGSFTNAELTVVSSTQLYFTQEICYPGSLGEWIVEVKNPQPGGGKSELGLFVVTEESFVSNPFLISLTPDSVVAGGPSFTIVVNGDNFVWGSQINFFSTPLQTTFVNSKQVRADVPASLITTPGKRPVTVTNPGNGGTSNKLFINVN